MDVSQPPPLRVDAAGLYLPEICIGVAPAQRGHGTGGALLDVLLARCTENVEAMRTNVHVRSPAQYLHQRKGIRVIGHWRTPRRSDGQGLVAASAAATLFSRGCALSTRHQQGIPGCRAWLKRHGSAVFGRSGSLHFDRYRDVQLVRDGRVEVNSGFGRPQRDN